MGVSGQLHALADLPQGKSPRYPLDRRLGGPQSRYGRCGEEENLAPAGNRTPAVQPVAIPTELSRLLSEMDTKSMIIVADFLQNVLLF
jgi:hypothetical protein